MKRIGNLYSKIYAVDNLLEAHRKAKRGKSKSKEIIEFEKVKYRKLSDLHHLLKDGKYKTSEYKIFTLFDPKQREIYKLPYYPDRITHHAILNIIEDIFVKTFTQDTYSCIKGRGIHKLFYKLKKDLRDTENTKYALKIDIRKFYPSINNDILKQLLRKKFKDPQLLSLLDEIINSTIGQPIGNYLSQFFANFYLSYFDHYVKEVLKVKYYYKYCDDILILTNTKEELHKILFEINNYLHYNLKLDIKTNYKIFPVDKNGIDIVGYKFFQKYILLRKSIKKRFIKMIKTNNNKKSIASYNGWLCHADCKNLQKKYVKYENT